ncbi:unnamed protein product [Darwinula stevensoni]|uniref:CARD domain-containing protein n=1 Tax=Darwinula stevensoni TaxID=69355 RepID=A0A7R8XKY8_9CRUS|nr:unnamed protein product [Darwinula stevensoni]CAG0893641.1 unnamed protein product [Darwinula stevensoni]
MKVMLLKEEERKRRLRKRAMMFQGTLFSIEMSEEPRSWDRIKTNRLNIVDKHVNCDELVRRLTCNEVFTVNEEKTILKIKDPTERNDEFFHTLYSKNPQTAVDVFFQALIDMQRQDVVDFLQDLKARIDRVWLKFIKIRNPDDVMKRMMNRGILNSDEIRTVNENKYKEQKMYSLGDVLGKKNGRNLPLISRCLLEVGHRPIAEELLHSSKVELDAYLAGSDFKIYGEKIMHVLEEGKASLLEVKRVLDSRESGEGMNKLKDMVECLKKSEEERMDQLKSMADSFEKSGGEIMERLQCVANDLKKSEGEGGQLLTSMIDSLKKSEEERMKDMKRVIDLSENSEGKKMGQSIFDKTVEISTKVDKLLLIRPEAEDGPLSEILKELGNVGKEKDQEIKVLKEQLLNMSKTLTEVEGRRAKSEDISKRLEKRLQREQSMRQKREAELNDAKTQAEEMQIQSENQSKTLAKEKEEKARQFTELKAQQETQRHAFEEQLKREEFIRQEREMELNKTKVEVCHSRLEW